MEADLSRTETRMRSLQAKYDSLLRDHTQRSQQVRFPCWKKPVNLWILVSLFVGERWASYSPGGALLFWICQPFSSSWSQPSDFNSLYWSHPSISRKGWEQRLVSHWCVMRSSNQYCSHWSPFASSIMLCFAVMSLIEILARLAHTEAQLREALSITLFVSIQAVMEAWL